MYGSKFFCEAQSSDPEKAAAGAPDPPSLKIREMTAEESRKSTYGSISRTTSKGAGAAAAELKVSKNVKAGTTMQDQANLKQEKPSFAWKAELKQNI